MTTHFSSGVTNVPGKGQATSLFSGIKQPLITGGEDKEVLGVRMAKRAPEGRQA